MQQHHHAFLEPQLELTSEPSDDELISAEKFAEEDVNGGAGSGEEDGEEESLENEPCLRSRL